LRGKSECLLLLKKRFWFSLYFGVKSSAKYRGHFKDSRNGIFGYKHYSPVVAIWGRMASEALLFFLLQYSVPGGVILMQFPDHPAHSRLVMGLPPAGIAPKRYQPLWADATGGTKAVSGFPYPTRLCGSQH